MRIAMVSEHASPLAALGRRRRRRAERARRRAGRWRWRRAGTRSWSTPGGTRRRRRRGCRSAPGVGSCTSPPARPADAEGRAAAAHGRFRATGWPSTGAGAAPDVVHAHFWMSGLAALRAAQALGVPVVQTFHALGVVKRRHQGDRDTSPAESHRTGAADRRRVDRVVATCTRRGGRAAVAWASTGQDHGRAVRGRHSNCSRPAHRDAIGIPRSPLRLLSVGRLVERKGVDTVIRALAGLPEAELVVAGGPPLDRLPADPEAARLLRLARDAGCGRPGQAARRRRSPGGCRRCSAPPTSLSAPRGTSRSASSRWRRWPAAAGGRQRRRRAAGHRRRRRDRRARAARGTRTPLRRAAGPARRPRASRQARSGGPPARGQRCTTGIGRRRGPRSPRYRTHASSAPPGSRDRQVTGA